MKTRMIWTTASIGAIAAAGILCVALLRPDLLPIADWLPIGGKKLAAAEHVTQNDDPGESALEAAPDDGWCKHIGKPVSESCPASLPTVRLASKDTAGQIGLDTSRVEQRQLAPLVVGNAEIVYASHEYAHVSSRVAGRVHAVPTDEGQTVKKGDVLVIVDSAEVGSAKAQYLSLLPIAQLARETFERTAKLRETEAASQKDYLAATAERNRTDADLMKARQHLLNLGFSNEEIAEIERTKNTSNYINIVAPMDGTLVERHAIPGEAVAPPSGLAMGTQTSLYEITDLHHLWCWIDVSETEVIKVAIGQPMTFTISGTEEPVFSGKVELIGFAVNSATRTVRVRAEVENIDGRLRSNQFGRALIQVGPKRNAVVVPRFAVQRAETGEEIVFLPQSDGQRFRTQRIETRSADVTERVEVTWGLKIGQEVVTTGSFLLKSELYKSSVAGE